MLGLQLQQRRDRRHRGDDSPAGLLAAQHQPRARAEAQRRYQLHGFAPRMPQYSHHREPAAPRRPARTRRSGRSPTTGPAPRAPPPRPARRRAPGAARTRQNTAMTTAASGRTPVLQVPVQRRAGELSARTGNRRMPQRSRCVNASHTTCVSAPSAAETNHRRSGRGRTTRAGAPAAGQGRRPALPSARQQRHQRLAQQQPEAATSAQATATSTVNTPAKECVTCRTPWPPAGHSPRSRSCRERRIPPPDGRRQPARGRIRRRARRAAPPRRGSG